MRWWIQLVLAVTLCGCVRSPRPSPAPVEEDRSIVFPSFAEGEVIEVGARGGTYELDGELLRALMAAANDFLPPGAENPPCRNRQEAQRYRVIRQGKVVFVSISEDPAYCGARYPALDSGAMYAIGPDGRILRRVSEGQSVEPSPLETADAGHSKVQAEPGVPPALDGIWNDPSRPMPPELQDGGSRRPETVPAAPSDTDGGSPGGP